MGRRDREAGGKVLQDGNTSVVELSAVGARPWIDERRATASAEPNIVYGQSGAVDGAVLFPVGLVEARSVGPGELLGCTRVSPVQGMGGV